MYSKQVEYNAVGLLREIYVLVQKNRRYGLLLSKLQCNKYVVTAWLSNVCLKYFVAIFRGPFVGYRHVAYNAYAIIRP